MLPDLDDPGEDRCIAVSRLFEAFLFFAEDSAPQHQPADAGWQAGAGAGWRLARRRRLAAPPIGFEKPARPRPPVDGGDSSRTSGGRAARRSRRRRPSMPAVLPPLAPAAAGTLQGGLAAPSPSLPRLHARIRVDAGQLDDLVGLAGELVVVTDNLLGLREIPGVERWAHALEALERVSREIRDTTLDLRMVPVDELFSRFPRVVRDLADRSGKEIELRIIGQDTRLDRTIVERLCATR